MPKVSQEHIEARKRQILEAAALCFARNGFHQTTMQDIVQQSGLSPGAIYTYYKSKEEIIEAIADERHRREYAIISEACASGDIQEALSQLTQSFFGALHTDEERLSRRVGVQIWAEALRNPQILQFTLRGIEERNHLLTKLIKEMQKRNEIAQDLDPDAIVRVMTALFQGFILQQAWDENIDVDAYVRVIARAFNGLLIKSE